MLVSIHYVCVHWHYYYVWVFPQSTYCLFHINIHVFEGPKNLAVLYSYVAHN